MIDITISIATEDNKDLLQSCLDSIYKSTKNISIEIYVVDNNSNDGTKDMIAAKFPKVKLISLSRPDGFSSNHNRIFKIAKGRNIVILNDDTIIKNGAFEKMQHYLIKNPTTGAIGPRIVNKDGSYQHSAFKFPNLVDFVWNVFLHRINPRKAPAFYDGIESVTEIKKVDWLLGACIMAPKNIIDKVGFFDEVFSPFYMEDADLCKRIKCAGYDILYYPKAEIIHYGAQTTMRQKLFMDKALVKNRIKFFRKHYGITYSICARCILIYAHLLNGVIRILKIKK